MTIATNLLLSGVTSNTVGAGVQYAYLANSPTSFSIAVSATLKSDGTNWVMVSNN